MVRVFGEVRVNGESLGLSSAKKLLLLLVVNPGKVWQRDQLCRMIWPSESPEITRNRLRTALVQLKKALGDDAEWGGGKHDLSVRWGSISSDFDEAVALRIKIGLTIDPAEEEAILEQLLKIIDQPLASDLPDFAAEKRSEWISYRTDALLKMANHCQSKRKLSEAITHVERALSLSPNSEKIWRSLLQLGAESGDHADIYKRFAAAKAELWKESNARFSAELVQLADNVRRQRNLAPTQETNLGGLLGRTLGRMLQDTPDRAIGFLGSSEFKVEVFDHPKEALEILTRALDATTGSHPDRMQCAVYAMIAGTVSEVGDRIEDFGHQVLEGDSDPARLRAAATMLGNIYFNQGDSERFTRMWQIALKYAEEAGNPVGIEILLIQRVIFSWLAGDDPLSILTGKAHCDRLKEFDEHNAHSGRAVFLSYLGTALACEGNFEEAIRAFSEANIEANKASHSEVLMLIDAPMGLCKIGIGEVDDGLQLLGSGIAERFRMASQQTALWGLLFAAISFELLGEKRDCASLLTGIQKIIQRETFEPMFKFLVRRLSSRIEEDTVDTVQFDSKNLKTLTTSTMHAIARLRQGAPHRTPG